MGWPVGVARGQLSPRAVTKLPTRPAVGERATIPGRTDRPTWASRFGGAVVTPTNHHGAHPVSASPVTTATAVGHPRWCSTHHHGAHTQVTTQLSAVTATTGVGGQVTEIVFPSSQVRAQW